MQDAHGVRALLWNPLNCKTHIIKSKAVPQKGFELQANLQAEVRHHTDPVGQITFIYIMLPMGVLIMFDNQGCFSTIADVHMLASRFWMW